jgi:stage V sporulation protein R
MSSKFFHGLSMLPGDSTTPGVQIPDDLKKLIPTIFQKCKDFGLDFYPTVIQMLSYDEISEVAAYGGFPVRYPHWQWGMEYEELQRGYEYGAHRIYEMVINTSPCYLYCLNSNTILDNVTVIAHALGHNDFFKNNVFFEKTSLNMINQLANHGTRIRKYSSRWGREKVTEFIDHCLRIATLIDPSKAWSSKVIKEHIVKDVRKWKHPKRLHVDETHDYMEPYINNKTWIDKQNEEIHREELAKELEIFDSPTKDVMPFIRDNAPLKPWQQDIIAMLYQESIYFAPQRSTKMMNEGWASYIDYHIMCKEGLAALGHGENKNSIIEYAKHKMGVLGGKYSTNPYKLGFSLFLDIEERWNKGRFGPEYENCTDLNKKLNWDLNLNLGKEKIFEVRKETNDFIAILKYFTPEFCEKHEFFNWKRQPNGDVKLEDRNFLDIKKGLMLKYMNGGLPEIELVDPNYKGKGYLYLEHKFDGRELYESYLEPVLQSLYYFWKNNVYLSTKNKSGEELIYVCFGSEDGSVELLTREQYDENERN